MATLAETTEPSTNQTPSAHKIKARRLMLDYEVDNMPRHFMNDGDIVMSHVVATLSALFPEGEDFFVRSVRRYRDQITDPELKRQVAGFIGQEANHGREHRNFNERLSRLGYPTKRIDRMVKRGLGFDERHRSAEVCLALTAALEHYTATLAEILLADERAQEMFTTPEVRELMLWHALEESEHKSVAFDVYQQVSGNTKIRKRIMNQTTVGFVLATTMHTISSLVCDPDIRDLRSLRASIANVRNSPFVSRDLWRRLRDYNRADFHPTDHDNLALTRAWRTKLFGDAGLLANKVKTAGA